MFFVALLLAAQADPAPVSAIDVCRAAVGITIATESRVNPASVVDAYVVQHRYSTDDAATQRAVCAIYFQAQLDLLGMMGPKS